MQSITHAPGEFHQSMTDIAKILAQGYMRIEKSRRLDPASDEHAADVKFSGESEAYTPETS